MGNEETYYDILGLDPKTCQLKDIKKAYRTLALQYHPDRVPHDKKEESTAKFRQVNEAYEVLSDDRKRQDYDRSLRFGTAGSKTARPTRNNNNNDAFHYMYQERHSSRMNTDRHFHHRDPFSQFNDLFRNDPFFAQAMTDLDDLFSKKFQNQKTEASKRQGGWGGWLLDKLVDTLGIEVSTSHSVRNADGTFSTSTYGRSSQSYTSKTTRTILENGRRITIQSMEKDGNRIEERYEGNKLIQRLVNGRPEPIGRIDQGGDL